MLPSSSARQSVLVLQAQVLVPTSHSPALQWSPTVQSLPSASQALLSICAVIVHSPDSCRQVLAKHAVSLTVGQVLTVTGLTSHLLVFLLQNTTPLQRSPSSLSAQSAALVHSQVFAEPVQAPAWQVSPVVHLL